MQQNQNWPFTANEMMNPYLDAYTRFVKNVFALEPVFSSGMDKNNIVEKQFDIFIKNAHHTLDYMKEMMFLFEHNFENNLARSKKGKFSSMATRSDDAKPFSSASTATASSINKSSKPKKSTAKKTTATLAAKAAGAKLTAKSTGLNTKNVQAKPAKKVGSSSAKTSSLKKEAAKKEAPKTASMKATEQPYSLGERNKELLDKNFKPISSNTKNSFTDKKI